MPENYYCYDNFFYKLTNMESPRKNNDCYFYYYSTCTKGDNCTFRHEPSALGCETVCSFWKEGKCLNVHCSFRHMELRKNRKTIPCYWENQPGGCLKPHCPFMHKSPKEVNTVKPPESKLGDLNATSSQSADAEKLLNPCGEPNYSRSTVDPLVVKFEEESDNESATTNSPTKLNQPQRVVNVKTLEEIRLEKIQAESAAFYSYPGFDEDIVPGPPLEPDLKSDDLRQRIMQRLNMKIDDPSKVQSIILKNTRKRRTNVNTTLEIKNDQEQRQANNRSKKRKIVFSNPNRQEDVDLSEIKIKTLAEIRAEKQKEKDEVVEPESEVCFEVSSTSNDRDELFDNKLIKLEETSKSTPIVKRTLSTANEDTSKSKIKLKRPKLIDDENDEIVTSQTMEPSAIVILNEVQVEDRNEEEKKSSVDYDIRDSSKFDDILFLDDEDDSSVTLRAEEDILKDIDKLLNDE